MSSPIEKIEIVKEIPFLGPGDSLENRLRNVRLRGFPAVKIYEHSSFETAFLTPEQIKRDLHTPQLRVYRTELKRIDRLAKLFAEKGINILNLDCAYDFIATSSSGEETEWTMLPPIVERFSIPRTAQGNLDYAPLIGTDLSEALRARNLGLNPDVASTQHFGKNRVDLINDGSHRVHYGFENGGIKVLRVEGMTHGFPYYAIPQPYNITVFETREEALKLKETKVHIVQDPAHKDLYRLFPSGGIKSGEVRLHEGKTS